MSYLNESLLKSTKNQAIYDPFSSPPDLLKAQQHRMATLLGKDVDDSDKICPCCDNVIQKHALPLNCQDEELLVLGVGYPLFYKLARYFGLIIFMIFVISGSGYYLLVTLTCQHNCVYFFGIPIINLQISAEDSAHRTDVINVITSFAIFGGILYIKSKIKSDIEQLEKKFVSPEQYTVMIQNLPQNINDQDINEWSKQNFGIKPTLINFAYNVGQLANAYKNRQKLTIKMNKINIQKDRHGFVQGDGTNNQLNQIKQKIQQLDNLISLYKQSKVVCHKIGTAFLTFTQQKTVLQILKKYQNTTFNTIFNKLMSPFRSPPLLFRGQIVVINQAPGPREVIWQNLSYSFLRSVVAQILFVLTMVLVLFFSFRLQYKIVQVAYRLRHHSQKTRQTIAFIQALAMSLVVVIVNALLRLLIKLFAYIKRYYSYGSYHSSFCFYYSISYVFNTCFMIYIVNGHREDTTQNSTTDLQQQNILIYDIHLLMLTNAISQPLFKIFDPQMWFRVIRRQYISKLAPSRNPYTQSYTNSAWEGYQIQIADNYQYIFRVLAITTWFAHSAPLGVVFSMFGLFADYWIGKYLLLRHYKRPEGISIQIARPMVMSLQMLPLWYICGVLQFTYKVSDSQNIFAFLYSFLKYGVAVVVIIVCLLGYLIIYKKQQQPPRTLPYDELELVFPFNYETENPITKFKGQIKYLYGVLKRGTNTKDQSIIRDLMSLNMKNKDSYTERQSMINKIKKKNLKRLETLSMSQEYYGAEMQDMRKKNSTSSDTSNQKNQD